MQTVETVTHATQNWIEKIVIGLNFCPFAAKPFKEKTIHYRVEESSTLQTALQALVRECIRLEEDNNVETSFIIFPNNFLDFEDYLTLVSLSEQLLEKEGYEGIFQVASFHPAYLFAGSNDADPANYTNRSPFPMLHLLREVSIGLAIKKQVNDFSIPEKNIAKAKELGLDYFKRLHF